MYAPVYRRDPENTVSRKNTYMANLGKGGSETCTVTRITYVALYLIKERITPKGEWLIRDKLSSG